MWPLNFWLAPAYSSASAPVAAMFAIMTKVGVYTVLRLWTLLFSGQAGASALFGGDWLVYGGMATIICAALAMVAAQRLERMASLSILVSAGILLSAVGFARRNAGNARYSFGTGKVGDLAGFASAMVLGLVSIVIAISTTNRNRPPSPTMRPMPISSS